MGQRVRIFSSEPFISAANDPQYPLQLLHEENGVVNQNSLNCVRLESSGSDGLYYLDSVSLTLCKLQEILFFEIVCVSRECLFYIRPYNVKVAR